MIKSMVTPPPPSRNKKGYGWVILILLGVALFWGIVLSFLVGRGSVPHVKVNETSAPWMPKGSSNGAYFDWGEFVFGSPAYYFEFDISEGDFRTYMAERKLPVEEIEGKRYIKRYFAPLIRADDFRQMDDYNSFMEATGAYVVDGLFFQEKRPNDDAWRHYLYDRRKGRAFVEIHTR